MKKWLLWLCCLLLLTGCGKQEIPPATEAAVPVVQETTQPPTVPTTAETQPPIVLELTEEEQTQLLKIAMAELGQEECPTCLALIMRTILNRVESPRFQNTIWGVLSAEGQFPTVADGSYDRAEPNEACREALGMVLRGWDETQGALFYEFNEGSSWHSKNLKLLTQHCNTRFYQG